MHQAALSTQVFQHKLLDRLEKKKNKLTIIWLDCANAYGSMPQKLVQLALEKYCVPAKTRQDIFWSNTSTTSVYMHG